MKRHRSLILVPLAIFAFAGCVSRYGIERWSEEPVIKVLVAENVPSITIEANGNHTLSSASGSMPVLRPGRWDISPTAGLSVTLNGSEHLTNPSLPLKIAPDERTLLKLNGAPYRGWLAVTPGTSSGLNVINLVPLEAYLYGVVPREIGTGSEEIMAAIEAQAICARSYAISHFGRHRREGFDIYADSRDQAYSGMARETRWCTQAVDATRGLVAFAGDQLIDARYHSTCGGRTANSEDVWSAAVPYLRSVRDAPLFGRYYCSKSPHYEWKKLVPTQQFYSVLTRFVPSGAKIKSWSLEINPRSRRVVKMIVKTNQGKHEIKGSALRTAFGLKSTWFRISQKGDGLLFDGRGWGHGVGMCQYGAMQMARRGKSAKRIIKHYYQGAWIGRLYR
ncbi:MAG: SpoIID/LytB domain-containing protein [Candidatus Stahlbacteria bacterium]|nr:MAG: SpoIID/LytB domain-containing protein [Candidatus Stahlbacteria bacterium]